MRRPRSLLFQAATCFVLAACSGDTTAPTSTPPPPPVRPGPPPPAPPPSMGTIEVFVTTSGATFDPDGYSVLVDGVSRGTIAIDGSVTIELAPGSHQVFLSDNAFNCYIVEKVAATVDVVADQTTQVLFSARCVTPITNQVLYETPSSAFGTAIVRVDPNNANVSQRGVIDNARNPSLSPDGIRIAFERNAAIYVAWVDGSDPVQLTSGGAQDPSWSSDGTRIAYSANGTGTQFDIFVLDLETGASLNVTDTPSFQEIGPSWSPDSQSLAYSRSGFQFREKIILRHLDSVDPDRSFSATSASVGLSQPVWSPDGGSVAYVSDNSLIRLMSLVGVSVGTVRTLGLGTEPAWSPDGSRIVFTSDRGGTSKAYVMSADGSNEQILFPAGAGASLSEHNPVWAR